MLVICGMERGEAAPSLSFGFVSLASLKAPGNVYLDFICFNHD